MKWLALEHEAQLAEINAQSAQGKVIIFKHSTRCSISASALNRLERNWNIDEMQHVRSYFLDLLSFRTLSGLVAQQYEIEHQSPQVLVIGEGACVYHESHSGITYEELKAICLPVATSGGDGNKLL